MWRSEQHFKNATMFIYKKKVENHSGMLDRQRSEKAELNLHKFLVLLLCFLIAYQYVVSRASTTDLKLTLLGPYNTTFVNTIDVYDKLIDLKNFSFLVNPQPCQEYVEGLLLVVIVSSKPTNYANRMVIRNTWGRTEDFTKMVFLLGETDNITLNQEISNESELFGDIVQGSFTDAYRNMTYKHVMGLKWVTHHCPMAKYVVKTDDDTVVNIRELRKFLGQVLSPWGVKDLISCHTYKRAFVQRSKDSKWWVPYEEFKDYYYPTYCAGWAILYSQNVVSQLLEIAQSMSYFWIDDVQVTGVCAQKIGVTPTSLADLILPKSEMETLIEMGPKRYGNFIFGPPDLTFYNMLKIWNALPKEQMY